MKIKVHYMSGAGNTFSVIDNSSQRLSLAEAQRLAPGLCQVNSFNPHKTEGLMLLDKSATNFDFSVEFFNPDGTHGAMCGNGGRCAVLLAKELGIIDDSKLKYSFSMASETYSAEFHNFNVRLYLPPPVTVRNNITICLHSMAISSGYVDVNSDHVVINIRNVPVFKNLDIRSINLAEFSLPIRHHSDFQPAGVNVNLYEVSDRNVLQLRTFERGVEAETGACGTGSVSTALISWLNNEVSFPVRIIPPSLIPVWVDIDTDNDNKIINIVLEGSAEIFDKLEIEIPRGIIS